MSDIESKIQAFLKNKNANITDYANEMSKRLNTALLERFIEKESDPFFLRMSNIGLPLRQLCLQRDYGRPAMDSGFTLNAFYGTMLEHLTLFLLKSSGVNVEVENKKTQLLVGETTIPGELDLIIDGAVWDIKSASPFAYDFKFVDYKSLEENDSFGYMAQLFGYAMAEKIPVGGWIVINKAKGLIKTVEVPLSVQKMYKIKYKEEFAHKTAHILNNEPAPDCSGVVPEFYRKKPTGNRILDRSCEYCAFKNICHPKHVAIESLCSEAKVKPIKYYTRIDKKYNV